MIEREKYANALVFVIFILLGLSLLKWYLEVKGVLLAEGYDFGYFYRYGKWMLEGKNPYALDPQSRVYPPISMAIYMPFTLIDFRTAWYAFSALNAVLLVSSVLLMVKILEGILSRSLDFIEKVAVAAIFLINKPLLINFGAGQNTLIVIALIIATWYTFRKGSRLLTGILLTASMMVKPILFLLMAYFVWKREWEVCASSFASAAFLTIASVLAFGLDRNVEYVSYMTQDLGSTFRAYAHTISLPAHIYFYAPSLAFLIPVVIALVGVVAVYATWGKISLLKRFDVEFPFMIAASMLISPLVFQYHLAIFIPPFASILFTESDRRWMITSALAYSTIAFGWIHSLIVVFPLWLALGWKLSRLPFSPRYPLSTMKPSS